MLLLYEAIIVNCRDSWQPVYLASCGYLDTVSDEGRHGDKKQNLGMTKHIMMDLTAVRQPGVAGKILKHAESQQLYVCLYSFIRNSLSNSNSVFAPPFHLYPWSQKLPQ